MIQLNKRKKALQGSRRFLGVCVQLLLVEPMHWLEYNWLLITTNAMHTACDPVQLTQILKG